MLRRRVSFTVWARERDQARPWHLMRFMGDDKLSCQWDSLILCANINCNTISRRSYLEASCSACSTNTTAGQLSQLLLRPSAERVAVRLAPRLGEKEYSTWYDWDLIHVHVTETDRCIGSKRSYKFTLNVLSFLQFRECNYCSLKRR